MQMTNTLNKEIQPQSEQAPGRLAAVNCLWMLAALSRPRAGTSTLLQSPALVLDVPACIAPACLKQKLSRGRGAGGTAVTWWPFS